MEKRKSSEICLCNFDKLPERAKEIFYEFLSYRFPYKCSNKTMFIEVANFYDEKCKSPIEHIFSLAFEIMNFVLHKGFIVDLTSQAEILTRNKCYIADFLFDTEEIGDEDIIKQCKPYKLVIECDGHEFHERTKEQVKKNNQRDYDLMMMGYEVLHFSGSQIYNEPFKCAQETLELIFSKIKK